MGSNEVYKLDTCKFKPTSKCTRESCPAWADGMCAFDIGDIVVRKAYDLIQQAVIKWQQMDKQQKIDGLAKILKML